MNFITAHIGTIIEQYTGSVPLSVFLKSYYAAHKQIGSRDRKAISEGVYIYYRCTRFYKGESTENIIAKGIELCNSNNKILAQKIIADKALPDPVFSQPQHKISSGLRPEEWLISLFQQSDLHIRLRKNETAIINSLRGNNIFFSSEIIENDHYILSFPNSTKVDALIEEQDYAVQDRSSQSAILQALKHISNPPQMVWDVCSGAGGKSLLLQDILKGKAQILATDIRKSILHNLQQRARLYNIKTIKTLVCDTSDPAELNSRLTNRLFDFIICDVPCSGSGTWARTPEQFYFSPTEKEINTFGQLQKNIAANAAPFLKEKGYFLYITCSVFEQENEAVVSYLSEHTNLSLMESQLINGIPHKADVMFYALFSSK